MFILSLTSAYREAPDHIFKFQRANFPMSKLEESGFILTNFISISVSLSVKVYFQREQYWIKRLKTLTPHGLNKPQELPPSHAFFYKIQLPGL